MRSRVLIIQKSLPAYRKPFFELLKQQLEGAGISFDLVYGNDEDRISVRKDCTRVDWAIEVRKRGLSIKGKVLWWQPYFKALSGYDLVIVEQSVSSLFTFVLFAFHFLGGIRLCFWGHGRNFQAGNPNLFEERLKRFLSRRVYWWFAYNDLSSEVVKALGFPEERITSVQNSVDSC